MACRSPRGANGPRACFERPLSAARECQETGLNRVCLFLSRLRLKARRACCHDRLPQVLSADRPAVTRQGTND